MKTSFAILCLAALSIGLIIRVQNLSSLHPFELDERVWLLAGTSLIQKGIPASWTIYWDKYKHIETTIYGGQNHVVVTPFLDHPPLFGIGMGAWAILTGNNTSKPLDWAILRLPMIALAIGTIVFTWLLLNQLFNPALATLTLVAFSFFPAHIIASRFIVAENIIAFLLVMCLWAFSIIDTESRKKSHKTVFATAVIILACGVAILFKLSAIVIPATIGSLALLRKNLRLFILVIVATVISLLLLAGYGAYYDWNLFMDILGRHAGRPQSFWYFWSIVTQLDLGYFPIRDPSIIVGFIGAFILLADTKIPWEKRLYIFVPLLNFSLLFLFIAPVESYGWYKYVLFPLLAIGLGYVFTELARGKVIYYALILPFIAIMLEQSQSLETHSQQKTLMLILYGIVFTTITINHYVTWGGGILSVIFVTLIAFLFFLELTWVSALISAHSSLFLSKGTTFNY